MDPTTAVDERAAAPDRALPSWRAGPARDAVLGFVVVSMQDDWSRAF